MIAAGRLSALAAIGSASRTTSVSENNSVHCQLTVVFDVKQCGGALMMEALASRRPGIDPQGLIDATDHRNMAVTDDDDVRSLAHDELARRLPGTPGRAGDMEHGDFRGRDLDDLLDLQKSKLSPVDISLHRRRRRHLAERIQHLHIAYIAGMNDVIDVGEHLDQFRIEPTVGIRDQSNCGPLFRHSRPCVCALGESPYSRPRSLNARRRRRRYC